MASLSEFLKNAFGIDTSQELSVGAPTPSITPTPTAASSPTTPETPTAPPTPTPTPTPAIVTTDNTPVPANITEAYNKLLAENTALKNANAQLAVGTAIGHDMDIPVDQMLYNFLTGGANNGNQK